jgi:hypothetical protein
MKKAIELYPDTYDPSDKYFFGPCDYQPILEEFGNILIQVDDNDYQGDSRVLLQNGNKYGILIFGWGSCSGCDSLQGCDSYEEIDELMQDIYNDIKWFESLDSCKSWVKNRDWELQYSYHCDETKEFINKVLNYN